MRVPLPAARTTMWSSAMGAQQVYRAAQGTRSGPFAVVSGFKPRGGVPWTVREEAAVSDGAGFRSGWSAAGARAGLQVGRGFFEQGFDSGRLAQALEICILFGK